TCTAYSDKGKHDGSLTQSEAGAVCARLKTDGLSGKSRIVGRGHAKSVATNRTRKGRAANRRVVISFTF
ncbi:MAG: OmpA family protein, partial [Solirubrobacteraceae bacterium]